MKINTLIMGREKYGERDKQLVSGSMPHHCSTVLGLLLPKISALHFILLLKEMEYIT